MNPPRRLRGTFGMCNLREGFVNLREGFVVAPWRLREAFSKTRSAKASRRRHGRLHLETIRQIMSSPLKKCLGFLLFCTSVVLFLLITIQDDYTHTLLPGSSRPGWQAPDISEKLQKVKYELCG